MAEGLEEGGKLYTFEINDEMEDFTRPWIEGSPVADKIEAVNVSARVQARVAPGTAGVDQALLLVHAQRLRMHARELGFF